MIETERLLLRNFQPGDEGGCFELLSDEQGCLDDGGFHAFNEKDEEFYKLMELFATQKNRYMIVRKEDGKVIGVLNLMEANRGVDAMEIGYSVAPAHRRKGYASEAVQGIVEYHFTNTDVELFVASCFTYNTASKRMLEKLGFTYEGIIHKGLYHEVLGPLDLSSYYCEKPEEDDHGTQPLV